MTSDTPRSAPRVPVQLPVSFDTGDAIGAGRISNISRTGALIKHSGREKTEPVAGSGLTLGIVVGDAHLRIHAKVARLTETGFAVEFVDLGPVGREVLEVLLRPFPVVERRR